MEIYKYQIVLNVDSKLIKLQSMERLSVDTHLNVNVKISNFLKMNKKHLCNDYRYLFEYETVTNKLFMKEIQ